MSSLWRWFVRAVVEARKRMLSKLSRSHRACPVECHTKLQYICPNNHIGTITWHDWKSGSRCRNCRLDKQKTITIDYVKSKFEDAGYILISDKYTENDDKNLKYICPVGHTHVITWRSWNSGARCPTCAIINKCGPTHYNWKGGISCEPYCPSWNDKEFKEYIKERDGYKCLNPCCSKKDYRLHIHHIDYNKKNCNIDNLITLCGSCNSKANTDREWHEAWYKAIMYKRYKYIYNI